jgi:hypothetical protein
VLNRANPSEADAADYVDVISEATGLVGGLLTLGIGIIVVVSADNLAAVVALLCLLAIAPLGWVSWALISCKDPIEFARKKRGNSLSWRSYVLAGSNILAVVLVFLVL